MEKNMNKKSYNVLNIVVIILLIVNAVYLITQKKAEKTVTDREPVSVDLVMRALNMKYFKINIDAAAGDENKGIFLEKVTPNGVVSSREIQNLKYFTKGETLYLFLREDGEKFIFSMIHAGNTFLFRETLSPKPFMAVWHTETEFLKIGDFFYRAGNENLTASPDKPHMLQGAEIGFRLNIKKSTLPH